MSGCRVVGVARGAHHSSRERVLRVILWCTYRGDTGEIQGYIGRCKGDIRYRRHLVVHLVQIRDRVGLGLGSGLGFRLSVKVRARLGG